MNVYGHVGSAEGATESGFYTLTVASIGGVHASVTGTEDDLRHLITVLLNSLDLAVSIERECADDGQEAR